MKNRISNPAKLRKLSLIVGERVIAAETRGNWDHAVVVKTESGKFFEISKIGTCEELTCTA